MLELNDVAFAHSGRPTLFEGVHLHAAAGSMIALVGPSGSGKSTLLALIGGLLTPSTGSVRWLGGASGHPRITWVPQTSAALPARSALDNVMLGSIWRGERALERRKHARDSLDRLGLHLLMHTRARNLSGGELQRVVVARTLVSGAEVVIADEPTSQNDPDHSRRVMGALRAYAAREPSRLVVVATHDTAALPAAARVFQLQPDGLHPVGSTPP